MGWNGSKQPAMLKLQNKRKKINKYLEKLEGPQSQNNLAISENRPTAAELERENKKEIDLLNQERIKERGN